MTFVRTMAVLCCLVLTCAAVAQTPPNNSSAPVSYSSIAELNQLIANLQQASESTQQDLSHLRIERWKTDSGTKHQTQSDSDSILRNLQDALPTMLADLKNSPENLALTFKVYRNLDALYDVLSSLVESAGAFGSREDFRFLSNDLSSIENSRHAFADRMDRLATAKDNEIGELRMALQTARAEAPPKKVIVDDTEPEKPKKSTSHKRTTRKTKKPPAKAD
jgi:hypothetical protein